MTGGGLNIPSNITLNNYVITVESGDINFNGSGHNLNNVLLKTNNGNVNLGNVSVANSSIFSSGGINMNSGARFTGNSLLATGSSNGNITFNGATSGVDTSSNLRAIANGDITYNGASNTRGEFVTAKNFFFNGSSSLYGAISAKGNITFNGGATVIGVASNSPTPTAPMSVNIAPAIAQIAGNTNIYEGEIAQFSVMATDANRDPLTFAIDFGDGTTTTPTPLTPQPTTHEYTESGTYEATVTVTDSKGASTNDTVNVTVNNVAPTIESLESSATSIERGEEISFSAKATDSGKDELTISWDFGDGSEGATGENVTHLFSGAGNYTVTLSVTDSDGAITTSSIDVTVSNDGNGSLYDEVSSSSKPPLSCEG